MKMKIARDDIAEVLSTSSGFSSEGGAGAWDLCVAE